MHVWAEKVTPMMIRVFLQARNRIHTSVFETSHEAASIDPHYSQSNIHPLKQTTSLFRTLQPTTVLRRIAPTLSPLTILFDTDLSAQRLQLSRQPFPTTTTRDDHPQRPSATRDCAACRLATRPNCICTTFDFDYPHRSRNLLRLPRRDLAGAFYDSGYETSPDNMSACI